MSQPDIFWFLPTHGDSRYLGTSRGARTVDYDYLKQIAVAADTLGYDGALIPTGRSCEDPWVAAASLIGATQRLRFLVAVRPGLVAPSVAARMAATFDRLSNGRLLINVVTGGDPVELAGDGLFLDHRERYEATGRVPQHLARHSERRDRNVRRKASARRRRKDAVSPGAEALPAAVFRRILGGSPRPRGEQVAARMREYAELGIDTFVLSGYPHLEEAYRFAELVFPMLSRERREERSTHSLSGPFGEIIANTFVPNAAQS